MSAAATPDSADKIGFRDLRVTAKIRESSAIASFYLEALDPQAWRPFQPGQFLVLRLPQKGREGGKGVVLRSYSLSCSPERKDGYRITVKREAAPSADLPDGVGSCYLHDCIQVGDVLTAEGPRGDFVLDSTSPRPVVLLSGGVGLTPLVSMLHALCATDRRTWFIHACDNGEAHALRAEVETLAASRPGVSLHFCYRFPTESDKVAGRCHSEGIVTRELLQRLLPLDDYDFYLCGPPPFMQAVHGILRGLGVAKERIAYEFFGPATLLEAAAAQPAPPADKMAGAVTVEFRKSGRTVLWDGTAQSLLTFAESHGLAPDFSCRVGVCGSCTVRLLAGEVSYFEEPLDAPADGDALLCCARPRGPVALDL